MQWQKVPAIVVFVVASTYRLTGLKYIKSHLSHLAALCNVTTKI